MSQVTRIEVTIGQLPEWYNEGEHDNCLELAIEKQWQRNPQFADATIAVDYSYNGPCTVVGFDDDGNRVFEREHDIEYAFEYAKENC